MYPEPGHGMQQSASHEQHSLFGNPSDGSMKWQWDSQNLATCGWSGSLKLHNTASGLCGASACMHEACIVFEGAMCILMAEPLLET